MTSTNGEGRSPKHENDPQHNHIHSADDQFTAASVAVAADVAEHIRQAQGLIRTMDAQRREVERAYRKGYTDCGNDLAYTAADAWEAGYDAAVADREAEWQRQVQQIRNLANSRSYKEKHAAELESLKPRPGDFPGLDNDPRALDRYRASVENIGLPLGRAA